MKTNVFHIHRTIGRPITLKGFKAQYIIIAAVTLIADFLLFTLLYCCGVNLTFAAVLTIGLGALSLSIIRWLSVKYGANGLERRFAAKNSTLPLLEVDHDCIVSESGDRSFAFELTGHPLHSYSSTDLDNLQQTLAKGIALLSPGDCLVLQNWFVAARFHPKPNSDSFLSHSSDRHFNEYPYREHRSYLYITRKFTRLTDLTAATELQTFMDKCRQLVDLLEKSGLIEVRKLTTNELTGTKERLGLLGAYHQLSLPPATLVHQEISLTNGLQIGDKYLAIYTISDAEQLPNECSSHIPDDHYSTDRTDLPIAFATKLGTQLNTDHINTLIISLDSPAPTLRHLETKRRRLKSLAAHDRVNEPAEKDVETYLQEAAAGNRVIVKTHYNTILLANTRSELAQAQSTTISAYTSMGITPKLESVGALPIFLAGQPGNAAQLPPCESFQTFAEQAACFFTPESLGHSSDSPLGLRFGDRASGVPLQVDLCEEPLRKGIISNFNKLLVGPSGSGKTSLCLHLVRQRFEQDAHITILDLGNSYKGLCEHLGGHYFAWTPERPLSFNPFWLSDCEKMDVAKRETLKTMIQVIWKQKGISLTRSEYTLISNMLESYYLYLEAEPKIFPCFDSFYEWLQSHFTQHIQDEEISETTFDFDNFLYILRPYYRGGEYDYLLNAHERLDLLHERLVVFELDAIKDHPILFPVLSIVIMGTYLTKLQKIHGVLKLLVMDEGWQAIIREETAPFIHLIYKTARKHGGEPIIATQELEDLLSSPVIRNTIINMSDCIILLDHGKLINRFDEVETMYGLSGHDKALLLSLNKANQPGRNYKEVFIKLGSGHSRVYRVELSQEEYLVYTTKETEKLKVQEYTRKYGSIQKGVSVLAADIRNGAVKLLLAFAFSTLFLLLPQGRANAQILDIIDAALKKVLMTADLEVQKLQTQTLVLQGAQKQLENTMQDSWLGEITGWVQKQEQLYSDYYRRLWQVKTTIRSYDKVRELLQKQAQLIQECSQAKTNLKQDLHFSPAEGAYLARVYDRFIAESAANIAQITLALSDFLTQMDDASRLQTIDETMERIDHSLASLRSFTQQTTQLSAQRDKQIREIQIIKDLYNIH